MRNHFSLLLLHVSVSVGSIFYGFTESPESKFVSLNSSSAVIAALWETPLPIEPYVAALDVPRGLVYAVTAEHTVTGVKIFLVAFSLANGTVHYNVSLPFGLYPDGLDRSEGIGHSAGTHTGVQLDVDPSTGDVLIGGMIPNVTHWRPADCQPACGASGGGLCCLDPREGAPACFNVKQCADISEPAGPSQFRQYKMSHSTRLLQEFETPTNQTWSETVSSALDSSGRILYVQLKMDAGTAPVTGMGPQYVYGYDIDTGKIIGAINTTRAVLAAQALFPDIADFEDMSYDPIGKVLVSVSLCIQPQPVQFARCVLLLDPAHGNITRLAPAYFDVQHGSTRVGVDSVLDPTTQVVYEFLPTHDMELVGYSTVTGKVAVDTAIPNVTLFPNNLELGS